MAQPKRRLPAYEVTLSAARFEEVKEQAENLGLTPEDLLRASLLDDSNAESLLTWARSLIRGAPIIITVEPTPDPERANAGVEPFLDD